MWNGEKSVRRPAVLLRLGITVSTLKRWQAERGFPNHRVGHRTVLYYMSEVGHWVHMQKKKALRQEAKKQ